MYSKYIETINAAINLLFSCGEGNNEITDDLDTMRLELEALWEDELSQEDAEREGM